MNACASHSSPKAVIRTRTVIPSCGATGWCVGWEATSSRSTRSVEASDSGRASGLRCRRTSCGCAPRRCGVPSLARTDATGDAGAGTGGVNDAGSASTSRNCSVPSARTRGRRGTPSRRTVSPTGSTDSPTSPGRAAGSPPPSAPNRRSACWRAPAAPTARSAPCAPPCRPTCSPSPSSSNGCCVRSPWTGTANRGGRPVRAPRAGPDAGWRRWTSATRWAADRPRCRDCWPRASSGRRC